MNIRLCPKCFGNKKLKAMQRIARMSGKSLQTADTFVKCDKCDGKGVVEGK
jgi:RecJ-like exonuclease